MDSQVLCGKAFRGKCSLADKEGRGKAALDALRGKGCWEEGGEWCELGEEEGSKQSGEDGTFLYKHHYSNLLNTLTRFKFNKTVPQNARHFLHASTLLSRTL